MDSPGVRVRGQPFDREKAQHRPKRKRPADSSIIEANRAARTWGPGIRMLFHDSNDQLQETGPGHAPHYHSWPGNPGMGVTETTGSGPTPSVPSYNANLPRFEPHHDATRLHHTDATTQACHHHQYNLRPPAQHYGMTGLVAQSPGHGPHAIPIAGHSQDPGENGFAPMDTTPAPAGRPFEILYDPSFQHHIHMSLSGQHAHTTATADDSGVGAPDNCHSHCRLHPPPLTATSPYEPAQIPAAGARFHGGPLPIQMISVPGTAHISSGTAASTGPCVTDSASTEPLDSTQASPLGHPIIYLAPQTDASSTSLADHALITRPSPLPLSAQSDRSAFKHFSELRIQPGLLGQYYRPYQFKSDPTAHSISKAMGGGEFYPYAGQPGERSSMLPIEDGCYPANGVVHGDDDAAATTFDPAFEASQPSGNGGSLCQTQSSSSHSCPEASDQGRTDEAEEDEQELPLSKEGDLSCQVLRIAVTPNSNPEGGLEPEDRAHKAKKRAPFDDVRRRETADTRWRKACLRCRVQKLRCVNDVQDAEAECWPCQQFSKTSKKTIHRISCYRGKLTDTVLFRRGGLNLTNRWIGTAMKDVGDRVDSQVIRTIHITLGVCDEPLVLDVAKFNTRPGDVTARFWYVREGDNGDEVRKKKELDSYCLANIWNTAIYFEKYIIDNAIPSILKQHTKSVGIPGLPPVAQDIVKRTYVVAVEHYMSLEDHLEGPTGKIANPEKKLLGNLFILWFAIRHTTGSAYICGDERLGMKPEIKDETYPLFGKVSLPRMIVAQFDSINHTKLLAKYGRKVLQGLESFIFRNQSRWWWTIYLCVFILLREASFISADRYRHARNNHGAKFRYSIPRFVEELQEGCNNILMHWHYYNCKPWPNPSEPWTRHTHFTSGLLPEQYDHVMETLTDPRVQRQLSVWNRYKKENGCIEKPDIQGKGSHESPYTGSQAQFDWDHPFYWVSQLFEEKWQPHPTYQCEYVL